jgi:hypothetical protein
MTKVRAAVDSVAVVGDYNAVMASDSAAPTFTDVARLITGYARRRRGSPPNRTDIEPAPWLLDMLQRVAGSRLMFAFRVEEKQPGRAQMREDLDVVAKAAGSLLGVIGGENMPILGHLDGPEPMSFGTLNSLGHGLRELRDRSEKARDAIPHGAGAGRAWANDSASPRVHCAMLISEAWQMVHGERPKPSNRTAQKAAQCLWRASGGVDKGWGAERSGWRPHFDAIPHFETERLKTQGLLEAFKTRPF